MADPRPNLPRRIHGTHLPTAAYRAIGIAKVPAESRWSVDDKTLRYLLNWLKTWEKP